jgi:ribonuclease BN (tRNA processing enzyme)
VALSEVGGHIRGVDIAQPSSTVLVIHPEGGRKIMNLDVFERLTAEGAQLPFGQGKHFDLSECLVVRMHRSNHPERTITYRFEERPSGKVFVFMTDHENQDALPTRLAAHMKEADLLVMDAQFTREVYDQRTAGWGHGTPDYCATVAHAVGAKALGLTHHDPGSSDTLVDDIVEIARTWLTSRGKMIPVFGCRDYLTVDVGDVVGTV